MCIRIFEFFVINKIQIRSLSLKDVDRVVLSFGVYNIVTIKSNLMVLKLLLKFLYESGAVSSDLSDKLPSIRTYCKSNIPSVWPKEDLSRIFAVVDTGSAIGKRNKVILLLASRLGIRGCDIRALKLSNFDWERDEIRFIQSKTQVSITLPLLPEIGEAVIEYLRYGRPPTSCSELIVRHNAPFEPFVSNCAMNSIITFYARKAGVKLGGERKHGIHSLRHTFASELLERNTPPSTIAVLLGHNSSNSVSVYLKTHEEALRECALDLSEVIASD